MKNKVRVSKAVGTIVVAVPEEKVASRGHRVIVDRSFPQAAASVVDEEEVD